MPATTTRSIDELKACWAALAAFVQNIHQSQYQLTTKQWQAAERIADAIPYPAPTAEDRILAIALAVMFDEIDAGDLSESEWETAERMLAEYTAHMEGR